MRDNTEEPASYPPEIQRFHEMLARLPGVSDIESGIESLQDISEPELSLAPYGHLPLGTLRRTTGGLPGEALLQFTFRLAPDASGWRSLEFLAWWTRDMARGGKPLQLRPDALPPRVRDVVQFGHTLKFHLDLFLPDAGGDLVPILAKVDELTRPLDIALKLYHAELYASRK